MKGIWFGRVVAKGLVYMYEKHERLQSSLKGKNRLQGSLVESLLQELRHTFWVLEHNVKELQGRQKPSRGLELIQTTHAEYVLFNSEPSLSLERRSLDAMEKYLRLANRHNILAQNGYLQMGASQSGQADRIFSDWSEDGKGADPIPMTMNELGPSIVHFARAIIKDLEMMSV